MAIGQIVSEDDLRAFILQQLRDAPLSRLVRQLQGQLAGRRLVGPFTANSGNLAPGAASGPFTLTHNIGHTNYWTVPTQVDNGFGYDIQWTSQRTANTILIFFKNVGVANPASMILDFLLLAAAS